MERKVHVRTQAPTKSVEWNVTAPVLSPQTATKIRYHGIGDTGECFEVMGNIGSVKHGLIPMN